MSGQAGDARSLARPRKRRESWPRGRDKCSILLNMHETLKILVTEISFFGKLTERERRLIGTRPAGAERFTCAQTSPIRPTWCTVKAVPAQRQSIRHFVTVAQSL